MIALSETVRGLRACDPGRAAVLVDAPDLVRVGDPRRDAASGVSVSTETTVFRLPAAPATLTALADDSEVVLDGAATRSLDAESYRLDVDAALAVTVSFEGPATVRWSGSADELSVSFPDRRPVRFGFAPTQGSDSDVVTVPRTPTGLAYALSCAAASHDVPAPDRSLPSLRSPPPRFEFVAADEADVPGTVPDTSIELRLPPSLEALFVAAPLSYYLGASVSVSAGATPRLRATDGAFHYGLTPLTEAAPALLRRAFWLDCLVRDAGDGADAVETALLEDLGVDAAAVRTAAPAERLQRYLDAPFEDVTDSLPEWHLSMYVESTFESAAVLPSLLDRLALVYPADTQSMEGKELMERSLDDFYRGRTRSAEVVKPRLQAGDLHGWAATGTPIDVFKTLPAAYANRRRYAGQQRDAVRIAVVLNEPAMAGEDDDVADSYRERAADLPLDVERYRDLTCAELAELFATDHSLVHYVGHCEADGLQCSDGFLPVADVEESNAETFFLNACGSYHEGLELVRKGSVGGAVTYRKVLDEQAATVGTTFARLVANGFGLERAISLARRRIMMGKDYAVVGDGTHRPVSNADPPVIVHVDSREDGYRVRCRGVCLVPGGCYRPAVPGHEQPSLRGNTVETTMTPTATAAFLDRTTAPVIYDGSFRWSDDISLPDA